MVRDAFHLVRLLEEKNLKLVLAESCTGGMISALLTQIPGVSQSLCGSLVTYRDDSKSRWLSIPPGVIRKSDAVSEKVTLLMARAALKQTPEAQVCAAITGHLGPISDKVSQRVDGQIFIALGVRDEAQKIKVVCQEFRLLPGPKPRPSRNLEDLKNHAARRSGFRLRQKRQMLASDLALSLVSELVEFLPVRETP